MKRIKILLLLLFIFTIIAISSNVQAAGVEGTTIVLNPRTWRRLDRLCKWFQKLGRKRPYFKNS